MLLLADEDFPKGIVDALRAEGNDVVWARADCPDWKDAALLDFAESEARIILTLDKDFWHIAVQRRVPLRQSGVVLFRVHPATSENIEPLIRTFVKANRAWAGRISVVSPDGIEMLSVGGG
jgi:predicted nuclease of predicted toxin-antitoxin system